MLEVAPGKTYDATGQERTIRVLPNGRLRLRHRGDKRLTLQRVIVEGDGTEQQHPIFVRGGNWRIDEVEIADRNRGVVVQSHDGSTTLSFGVVKLRNIKRIGNDGEGFLVERGTFPVEVRVDLLHARNASAGGMLLSAWRTVQLRRFHIDSLVSFDSGRVVFWREPSNDWGSVCVSAATLIRPVAQAKQPHVEAIGDVRGWMRLLSEARVATVGGFDVEAL